MNGDKQHVDEELLIRYIIGETSESEAERVDLWIRSSPKNAAQFDALSATWAATVDQTRVQPADVNTDAAWGKQLKTTSAFCLTDS